MKKTKCDLCGQETKHTISEEQKKALEVKLYCDKCEQKQSGQSNKKDATKHNNKVYLILLIIIAVSFVWIGSQSGKENPSSNNITTTKSTVGQIPQKEQEITQIIQSSLDTVFQHTELAYRVNVEIGDINSSGIIGWLNIYPENEMSWNLLDDETKKDFVATMVSLSQAEINDIGQVYVKNNVRVLAEGRWSITKGKIIELK
jgi:hypothetical protein